MRWRNRQGLQRAIQPGRRKCGRLPRVEVVEVVEDAGYLRDQRQVTLLGVQVTPRLNVGGEPLAVREGHHAVLCALPVHTGVVIADRSNPQSLTKARSSSRQPAMPHETARRKPPAKLSANSPVRAALSTSDTSPPSVVATWSPVMLAELAFLLKVRGERIH